MALHMYTQEVSGNSVNVVTATVRTIENTIVIIASEKIPARANFVRDFI